MTQPAPELGYLSVDLSEPASTSAHGEFDLSNVTVLATALMACARCARDTDRTEVRLDARDVTFIDMPCIDVVLDVHRTLAGEGRRLTIVEPSRQMRRVLQLVGLDAVLTPSPASVA